MCSKIYGLRDLIDIKNYAKWADDEIYKDFAKKLAASRRQAWGGFCYCMSRIPNNDFKAWKKNQNKH